MLNTYLYKKRILKFSILFLVFSDSVGIQVSAIIFQSPSTTATTSSMILSTAPSINPHRYAIHTHLHPPQNPRPNPSTSGYGLAAMRSSPGTAASPSNMTSTKTVQVEGRTSSNA